MEEVLYLVLAYKDVTKDVKSVRKAVVESMEEIFVEQSLVEFLQSLGGWL